MPQPRVGSSLNQFNGYPYPGQPPASNLSSVHTNSSTVSAVLQPSWYRDWLEGGPMPQPRVGSSLNQFNGYPYPGQPPASNLESVHTNSSTVSAGLLPCSSRISGQEDVPLPLSRVGSSLSKLNGGPSPGQPGPARFGFASTAANRSSVGFDSSTDSAVLQPCSYRDSGLEGGPMPHSRVGSPSNQLKYFTTPTGVILTV